MISTGHARAIISVEDPEEQYTLAQKIFDEKMSVRDVEKYIKNMNKPEKEKKKVNKSLEVIYKEKEEILKQSLLTKVAVVGKGDGSGKIEIEFFSHDDFDRIMDAITKTN
jgi:ParB family chromosome partitioning protein